MPGRSRVSLARLFVYSGFALNGIGVVLIGPLLPYFGHAWHAADVALGALLTAQFLGSSLGTILVMRRAGRAIFAGLVCSVAGLCGLALLLHSGTARQSLVWACAWLAVYGFGLGQAITALNLSVAEEEQGRSARLSLGNGFWSLGAIASPLIAAFAVQRVSLAHFLVGLAAVFALLAIVGAGAKFSGGEPRERQTGSDAGSLVGGPLVAAFAVLLLLYGGAETCFSAWLTTLASRTTDAGEVISASTTSAFWLGVAAGRFIASAALRPLRGDSLLYLLPCGAAMASLPLLWAHSTWSIVASAAATGMLVGPVFPIGLGRFISMAPSPRQAGLVLAACGCGVCLDAPAAEPGFATDGVTSYGVPGADRVACRLAGVDPGSAARREHGGRYGRCLYA